MGAKPKSQQYVSRFMELDTGFEPGTQDKLFEIRKFFDSLDVTKDESKIE